jgi:hypothetical protein
MGSLVLALCFGVSVKAQAQYRAQASAGASLEGKSAQGTLTVTATVVSSVGIVMGIHGEQVLIVANAPAAKDNVLALTAVQTASPNAAADQRKTKKNVPKHPDLP